jgi:hypothetical protein
MLCCSGLKASAFWTVSAAGQVNSTNGTNSGARGGMFASGPLVESLGSRASGHALTAKSSQFGYRIADLERSVLE